MDQDQDPIRSTIAYLDGIFGPGAGEKHVGFLRHIENDALREMILRYHALEGDTTHLSLAENYLIGMCVLCATKSYATAGMFAKTLLHLGVEREKILAALARLAMWIGGIPAAEATAHMQRAMADYEQRQAASLEVWFPDAGQESSPRT